MDQTLLDSSRYKISSLSVDTRFADQYYHGSSDFMIRLPSTIRNVMRVALTSVELPLVAYLFSTCAGNLNFSVNLNGTGWVDLAISEGNYTECQLISEVAKKLQTVDIEFAVSINEIMGRVTIYHKTLPFSIKLVSSDATIACRPTHWGLGYYLGFRSKRVIVSKIGTNGYQEIIATSALNVQVPTYYLLQLMCPEQVENMKHRVSAGGYIPAFAKLILRDSYYCLQFNDGGDNMRREYTFLSPVALSHLRVRLVDPYGVIVNMRDMDWSMTFEIYEVVNSRTFNYLNQQFNR